MLRFLPTALPFQDGIHHTSEHNQIQFALA